MTADEEGHPDFMSEWHSIWLQPCYADLADLDRIVKRLAGQFETKVFIPHLTLVEDMERSADDLAQVLETRFTGEKAFGMPITEINGLPLFFRSLFAAFEPAGNLLALKKLAVDSFGVGELASFMPHISLAYGTTDEQKASVFDALRQQLVGRVIRFDAIAVVASAQSIPIEDWAVVHSHKLV
jgi:2'-5' RNA ligase